VSGLDRCANALCIAIAALGLAGCQPRAEPRRLPTGVVLDPAGTSVPLGSMPLTMVFSPDSSRIVIVLSGYREQGIQVVDRASRRLVQTIVQPAAFLGVAFAPDGRTLYVSGGNRDVVYRYAWNDGSAALVDSIALGPPPGPDGGRAYPSGLACSPDGRRLYVAENLADSLAVVDPPRGAWIQRSADRAPSLRRGRGPGRQRVRLGPGSLRVASFTGGRSGLVPRRRIEARHPRRWCSITRERGPT
jgi:DNA-binding beta-propeller fold protein YncE